MLAFVAESKGLATSEMTGELSPRRDAAPLIQDLPQRSPGNMSRDDRRGLLQFTLALVGSEAWGLERLFNFRRLASI
jgi:hypothetical protein